MQGWEVDAQGSASNTELLMAVRPRRAVDILITVLTLFTA